MRGLVCYDVGRKGRVTAMDQEKIGRFLGQVRRERGLTQEQLAQRLGVSQRTVSRWETGVSHS